MLPICYMLPEVQNNIDRLTERLMRLEALVDRLSARALTCDDTTCTVRPSSVCM